MEIVFKLIVFFFSFKLLVNEKKLKEDEYNYEKSQ